MSKEKQAIQSRKKKVEHDLILSSGNQLNGEKCSGFAVNYGGLPPIPIWLSSLCDVSQKGSCFRDGLSL